MEKWVLKFGAPKEIHVDCGKTFESKTIAEMAKVVFGKKIGKEQSVPRIKQDQKEKRIEDILTKRSFKVGEQVLVRREKKDKRTKSI